MSPAVGPLLNGRCVRSGGGTERSLAEGPSPRASLPWHSAHSPFTYTRAPRATASAITGGAAGIGSTLGGLLSAERGDRLFTSAPTARPASSLRCPRGHTPLGGMPNDRP